MRPAQDSTRARACPGRRVTAGAHTYSLPAPFAVFATQNPIEQEGTYPLPEAQLDRFLLKIRIDYPSEAEEVALTRQVTQAKTGADLDVEAVATLIQPATVVGLQQWAAHVTVDERVVAYAVAIVIHIAATVWFSAMVVRDILRPAHDPVRNDGAGVEDPLAGPLAVMGSRPVATSVGAPPQ